MPEQQYTCPKCFKDYTRFTIHEHYACGVEPLGELPIFDESRPALDVEAIIEAALQKVPKKRGPKPKAK